MSNQLNLLNVEANPTIHMLQILGDSHYRESCDQNKIAQEGPEFLMLLPTLDILIEKYTFTCKFSCLFSPVNVEAHHRLGGF